MNSRGTYRKGQAFTTGELPDEALAKAARRDPYAVKVRLWQASVAILRFDDRRRGSWVPALAGATPKLPHPLAAVTLAKRRRMRINRPSQTSR